jgi:DNA-binding Lrp family transcriptional regulator
MPTLRSMIEEFMESNFEYQDKKVRKILLGDEKYSLVMQAKIAGAMEKNIIKKMDKTMLSTYITEAVGDSLQSMRSFNDRIFGKEIYNEMAYYLNENYEYKIDLNSVNEVVIETSEERCLYLLRETERENNDEGKKTMTEIADELGCSRRVLEKDIKKMTEQGFKLLGMNIKLIDEDENIFKMGSTPHPLILMQNISQIFVLLEGLRAMEKISAFSSFARATSCSIWNQLTKYTKEKIMDAVEKLGENQQNITWYFDLDSESKEYSRFITEIESCEGNSSSQLMYLGKNGGLCNITYIDNKDSETTINECSVVHYHPYYGKATVKTLDGQYEIDDDKIVEIEII